MDRKSPNVEEKFTKYQQNVNILIIKGLIWLQSSEYSAQFDIKSICYYKRQVDFDASNKRKPFGKQRIIAIILISVINANNVRMDVCKAKIGQVLQTLDRFRLLRHFMCTSGHVFGG